MTTAKIAFVLDCTASMEPWIQASKNKIEEIIAGSRADFPQTTFEVAIVAYRDYSDLIRFRVVDFTTPNQAVDSLRMVHAEGGDDDAEDVAGALLRASRLSWGGAEVCLLFHIADAPAHGMKFHAPSVSDDFPDGDPEGINPLGCLARFAKMGVHYTFVKITSTTDKMVDVFYDTYVHYAGVFRVIDLKPQSYDGRFGYVDDGDTSQVLGPAIAQVITESLSLYTSSQGR